ncbi:hypothetical protein EAI_06802 [Harpegnathos saltator]|uniref:Uncharacterized protein n=1 Tax=Harpegnathos saltator TaxID=610380 RepID=E2BB32_HARSA|nr:hypothetical protein EAI_06802 [Harpegnathos saltator]
MTESDCGKTELLECISSLVTSQMKRRPWRGNSGVRVLGITGQGLLLTEVPGTFGDCCVLLTQAASDDDESRVITTCFCPKKELGCKAAEFIRVRGRSRDGIFASPANSNFVWTAECWVVMLPRL